MTKIEIKPTWITEKEITALLHKAYARHLDAGLHFSAAFQSEQTTKEAMQGGKTYVALDGSYLCGTLTAHLHYDAQTGKPYTYLKMIAVDPDYQGQKISEQLIKYSQIAFPESQKLVLDTAAEAEGLVRYYEKLGFKKSKYFCWDTTNYISVQLEKELSLNTSTKPHNPIGIYVTNSPQVYSTLPIAEELHRRGIGFDFVVPDFQENRANWDNLFSSTSQLLSEKGYTALKVSDVNCNYKIIFAPYYCDILRYADCAIRYRYSVITKPDFSYKLENTTLFDYILCYGIQDCTAFSAYAKTLLVGNPRALNFKKIPHEKKTILYAPTYNSTLDFDAIASTLISLKDKYHIILKLHPGSEFLDEYSLAAQKLRNSCSEVVHGNEDIMDLLQSTDLLISDYSGAVFDAISVNIPSLLIRIGDTAPLTRDGSVLNQLVLDQVIPCCFHSDEVLCTVAQILDDKTTDTSANGYNNIFSIDPSSGLTILGNTVEHILEDTPHYDYMLEHTRKQEQLIFNQQIIDAQSLKIVQLRQSQKLQAQQAIEIEHLQQQLRQSQELQTQQAIEIEHLQQQISYYENGKLYKIAKKLYNLKGVY